MEIRPIAVDDEHLARIAGLFNAAFPQASHLTPRYLSWLYRDNPNGQVVGFDALEGDRLAAHYACIPSVVDVGGARRKGLLSLNTATHPGFQGKGLFTKLANATYAFAAEHGFDFVYGVANANSTPGFTRKLGFQLVAPLDARLKLGGLPSAPPRAEPMAFARTWSLADLRWRLSNPNSRYWLVQPRGGDTAWIAVGTGRPGVACCAPSGLAAGELSQALPALQRSTLAPVKLFLGFDSRAAPATGFYFKVPDRLRPSPLNLIFRGLPDSGERLDGPVRFSFLDFDPY